MRAVLERPVGGFRASPSALNHCSATKPAGARAARVARRVADGRARPVAIDIDVEALVAGEAKPSPSGGATASQRRGETNSVSNENRGGQKYRGRPRRTLGR